MPDRFFRGRICRLADRLPGQSPGRLSNRLPGGRISRLPDKFNFTHIPFPGSQRIGVLEFGIFSDRENELQRASHIDFEGGSVGITIYQRNIIVPDVICGYFDSHPVIAFHKGFGTIICPRKYHQIRKLYAGIIIDLSVAESGIFGMNQNRSLIPLGLLNIDTPVTTDQSDNRCFPKRSRVFRRSVHAQQSHAGDANHTDEAETFFNSHFLLFPMIILICTALMFDYESRFHLKHKVSSYCYIIQYNANVHKKNCLSQE